MRFMVAKMTKMCKPFEFSINVRMLVHAIEIAKVVAQEKLLKNYSQVQKLSESSF